MKKNIIVVILLIVMWVICFIPLKNKNKDSYEISENYMETEIYSQLMQVKKCDYENEEIILQDYLGNEYIYKTENLDIYETEFYCCTMFKNKTDKISDDIVLNIKYQRLDLWNSLETVY